MDTKLHRIASLEDVSAREATPDEVSLRLVRAKAIVDLIAEGAAECPDAVAPAAETASDLLGEALDWHSQ